MGSDYTTTRYTVEERPLGTVVFGHMPLDRLTILCERCENAGRDQFDIRIAQALGATLVITSEAESKQWRAELGLSAPFEHEEKPDA